MPAKQYPNVTSASLALWDLLREQGYTNHESYAPQNFFQNYGQDLKLEVVVFDAKAQQHILAKLKHTEACCAVDFLYSFTYSGADASMVKLALDFFLARADHYLPGHKNYRFMVNMVEKRSSLASKIVDPKGHLLEVEPIEKPIMKYPLIWEYFHKNAARVNTRLMPNVNTGNIIHNMECIFAPDYFNDK